MDAFTQAFGEWTGWILSIYYAIDRMWLGLGLVGSTLAGVAAGRLGRHWGPLWRMVLAVLVGIAVFVAFLAATQFDPVFFDAGDLARRKLTM